MNERRAYIGLGGNVGDVLQNMRYALDALHANKAISILNVSRLYKTPPWGNEDQDWFLNACAELKTNLLPQELLNECLEAEASLNRVRKERWGPRTIDLDILDYDNQHIETETLVLPHPRMHLRAFVLKPLLDIAPDYVMDEQTSAAKLLEAISAEEIEVEINHQNWWPKDPDK